MLPTSNEEMKISEINTAVSFSVLWEQGEAVRADFHLV